MAIKPTRIRLSRAKGFNLQETSRKYNGLDAVKVDRSNINWGNPLVVGRDGTPEQCLEGYREYLREAERLQPDEFKVKFASLRNKNLACWCALDAPCHVDVLLELLEAANV